MKHKVMIALFSLLFVVDSSAQTNYETEIKNVKNVLEIFKSGYAERDTSKAKEWCDRLFYDNVEIIGTYSIHSNSMEWFSGKERAISVFKSDWKSWGDLKINLETSNINVDETIAWVSCEATVTRSPDNSRGRTAMKVQRIS